MCHIRRLDATRGLGKLSYSFRKPRATPHTHNSHFPSQIIGVLVALRGGKRHACISVYQFIVNVYYKLIFVYSKSQASLQNVEFIWFLPRFSFLFYCRPTSKALFLHSLFSVSDTYYFYVLFFYDWLISCSFPAHRLRPLRENIHMLVLGFCLHHVYLWITSFYCNPAAVVEGAWILFTSQIAKHLLRSCAIRRDTCLSVDQ